MLKKTITYTDFDGQQRTEDHYFNLTQAELTEMELSLNGGLSQLLEKIIQENDQRQIIEYFKKIVIGAYGIKGLDGRTFMKNDQIREEFASTMAYSEIFMELATDADKAAEFVKGIMPADMDKRLGQADNKPQLTALPGKAPVPGVTPPATN